MTKPLIDQAVDLFLGWKLPEDFNPDGGITFKPTFNDGTPYEARHIPIGTNLLHAGQAKAMLEHVAAPLLAQLAEAQARVKALEQDVYAGEVRERDDLRRISEARARIEELEKGVHEIRRSCEAHINSGFTMTPEPIHDLAIALLKGNS